MKSLASTKVRRALAELELAPFDSSHWTPALRHIMAACNARFIHLIAREPDLSDCVPGEIDSEETNNAEWHAAGGADPAQNPYMRATLHLKPHEDVTSPEITARYGPPNPLVQEILSRNDGPYFSAMNILERDGAGWYLGSLRSGRQGPLAGSDRALLQYLGRAAGNAVCAALAIKQEGARLLSHSLDALGVAALVYDVFGRVIAISSPAERLVKTGEVLRLHKASLCTNGAAATKELERAVLFAARYRTGTRSEPCKRFYLPDKSGYPAAVADAIPLPRDRCDIGFGAAALLVIEEMRNDPQSLARRFKLTEAESEVAALLLQRLRIEEIADRRCVSRETIRSQTKAIYAKAGVSGQIELIARLHPKEHWARS